MQFSKVAVLAAVTGSALASYNSTVHEIATTVITITSCEDNKCTALPVTTGLTTVTEYDTIYTTYCPLPTETEAEVAPSQPTTVAAESSSVAPSSTPASNNTIAPIEGAGNKLQVGAALIGAAALLF
ncbi:hypothetical protein KGF56_000065 [Candida oxycetoniae]|uniref:Uncharacterized protein n=1 Tax=Candida oxycetoniae TaxID=497107 RepID=A0AAI9T1C3_9ASCO|nr:uncharacterized protein KGF56_000065 [Candida oxycetoniae]KAI3407078.1 hypothetical protein KGF56_000065 [Candida oxycetoniae]